MSWMLRVARPGLAALTFCFTLTALANQPEPTLPAGLREAFDDAAHGIEVNREQPGTFWAQNPASALAFGFAPEGVRIRSGSAAADWEVGLVLEGWGQEGDLRAAGPASLLRSGRRVELRRDGITEWYVNRSAGMEQGFTLERPPAFDAAEPLLISMTVTGEAEVDVSPNGRDAAFSTAVGQAFAYSGLKAFDAAGQALPARLDKEEGGLRISVEVGDAPWPVTVDPVIWTETVLVAADPDPVNGVFGNERAVALDGDTAVIGDAEAGVPIRQDGAAYVFVRTGKTWSFQAKLVADDSQAFAQFGESVAIDGDVVVVGAPYHDDIANSRGNAGAAYVFERSGSTWTQTQKLMPLGVTAPDDYFGWSVAVEASTTPKRIVAGATGVDLGASNAGAVFVFHHDGATWNQIDDLHRADSDVDVGAVGAPSSGDQFGYSVATDGNTILIGVPGANNGWEDSGIALTWTWNGASYGWEDVLKPSTAQIYLGFGYSLDLYGDTALIGTAGNNNRAFVLTRSAGAWSNAALLTSPAGDSGFGHGVALGDGVAVVGGVFADASVGAAYVFTGSGSTWNQVARLTPVDEKNYGYLGDGMAISGNTILAGALGGGAGNTGEVYVFDMPVAGWADMTETASLEPVNVNVATGFGSQVAIFGQRALVNSSWDSSVGYRTGAVYVFVQADGVWELEQKLTDSGLPDTALFGGSIALDGNTAIIGAKGENAVYIFARDTSTSTWFQQAKLVCPDPGSVDEFGIVVGLDGDTAFVSNPNYGFSDLDGRVYVYSRSGNSWGLQARIDDPAPDGGRFGLKADLKGDHLIVGKEIRDEAYIFERSGGAWSQQAHLTGTTDTFFGQSVAIHDPIAVVAAAKQDVGSVLDAGQVFVYERSGSSWLETQTLTQSPPTGYSYFGISMDLTDRAFVVGAYGVDSADIYVKAGSYFIDFQSFQREDSWHFGGSVAASEDTVIVGAYSATFGLGDENGGKAHLFEFDCGIGGGVRAGRWNMIGIPCDLGSSNTVADVFGDNFDTSRHNIDWSVWRRDAANDRYQRLGLASTLSQDEGYWLYSSNWGTWDAAGTRTAWATSGTCASPTGCYEVPLTAPDDASSARYVMVGHPGTRKANWAGVTVMVDGTALTPFEAEENNYLSKTIWKWNGTSYDAFDDGTTPGMEGTLYSHEGIWVKVLGGSFDATSVSLLFPDQVVGSGPPGPPGMMAAPVSGDGGLKSTSSGSRKEAKGGKPEKLETPEEWYLRLSVHSESMTDRGNILGQMLGSEDGYDRRDLTELAPLFKPYLTLVFPHRDWGSEGGDFASDYHDVEMDRTDTWDFEVRSDAPWREVTLTWDPLKMVRSYWDDQRGRWAWAPDNENSGEPLMAKMWLLDVDTGELVKILDEESRPNHVFNMDGATVRHFRWIYSRKGSPTGK